MDEDVVSVLLDMFFAYPWNGFLHSLVAQLLDTALRGTNAAFKTAILDKCQLLERLLQAVASNTAEEAKEKGMRRGCVAPIPLPRLTTDMSSVRS